ncbi:MAG: aryl-sulfate sulfotransferase [Flavobacteriaceae bacterium]
MTKIRFLFRPLAVCVLIAFMTWLQACTGDDLPGADTTPIAIDSIPKEPENPIVEIPDFTPEGIVEVFNADKMDDSFILVNDAASNRVYLMNKEARLLYEWNLTNNIGNDVFLLDNGRLLASLESDNPQIKLGGKGGRLQFVAPDGTLEWDFIYSSSEAETHHDAELLPNGNIIALVWPRKSVEVGAQAGFMLEDDVFPESIIEIDPTTNEIVWEWHSWDHLIQDHDVSKDNYGVVADHPERIDINYVPKSGNTAEIKGDIMHANAIAYDEVNDVILLSVNFYSEVWAIDHSTTTEEAASSTGGNYGKGGDLIYRFGNPEAYENAMGNRMFHNQHFPNLLHGEDQGKLLIFSNGNNSGQSKVFELQLPSVYNLQANVNNELKVIWSFTDPDLHSARVSGAVPLPNGNILITEGDFGFWEVTREKEVVWKCNLQGFIWRGYSYNKNSPEILALDLPQ